MKKNMIRTALATVVLTVIGCSTLLPPSSMRGVDVSDVDKAPEAKSYAQKVPGVGEAQLIPRTFINQPPMIPHTTEKYEPLTLEENACMDCHLTEELRGKAVPQIGKSHFSKTEKNKDGSPALEMTRFQCNNCHVPQVDAKPLVENAFIGVTK